MTQSDTQIAGFEPRAGASSAPPAAAMPPPTETHNRPAEVLVEGDQTRPADALVKGNQTRAADALVGEDLLVEDVSIDGMCGVY